MLKSNAVALGIKFVQSQIANTTFTISENGELATFTFKNKDGEERGGKVRVSQGAWVSPHSLFISINYHRSHQGNDNHFAVRRNIGEPLKQLHSDAKAVNRLTGILKAVEHTYEIKKSDEARKGVEQNFADTVKPQLNDLGYKLQLNSGHHLHNKDYKLRSDVSIEGQGVEFKVRADDIELIKRLKAVCDNYASEQAKKIAEGGGAE